MAREAYRDGKSCPRVKDSKELNPEQVRKT